jgi:O-antigen/teichoic acid export membrane protein
VKLTPTRRNLLANFVGSGWSALLGLAVLPFCLRLMGIEGYGLVGVFATLMSLLSPLEAGLGSALNRELAASTAGASSDGARDVVRTLEVVNWSFAVLCGAIIAAVAPLIAFHWIKPEHLTQETVRTAIMIMGLVVVFQWPLSLYSGGLAGLQRQVTLNLINGVMGTFRGVGSVLVLYFISPTVIAYFLFQIVASLAHTTVLGISLWRALPPESGRPRFRKHVLIRLKGFLAGMSGISVVLLCLTQLDKVILSRLLPLGIFGYYSLASSVAANLLRLVTPVQQAVFPRFTALAASGEQTALASIYHRSAQLIAILTIPVAIILIVFPREVLYVWMGDLHTAQATGIILSVLTAGTLVNALLYPPYTLQIAYGWTRLIFSTSLAAAIVLVPALILLAMKFGAVGASAVWLMQNLCFVFVLVPFMHRRLLRGEMKRWFVYDTGLPLAAGLSVAILGRLLLPEGLSRSGLLGIVGFIGFLALLATAAMTREVREEGRAWASRFFETSHQ